MNKTYLAVNSKAISLIRVFMIFAWLQSILSITAYAGPGDYVPPQERFADENLVRVDLRSISEKAGLSANLVA